MRDRIVRTIVFFDLPMVYNKDKKNYIKFRRFLINDGFLMMQESVYSKIVLTSEQANYVIDRIRKHAPKNGLIQVLKITEKQYSQIENIIGEPNTKVINSDDRMVIL